MSEREAQRIYFNHFKSFYFIGIAGAGMSALAQIMHAAGFQVAGSDLNKSDVTEQLLKREISVVCNHNDSLLLEYEVIVVSSAIDDSNPEYVLAKRNNKVIISRGELLAVLIRHYISIAIAGSHGKTTTASLLKSILLAADYDPTCAIGVQPSTKDNNFRLGTGPYFILEVDESDASFLKTRPNFCIVTSIDADHLNNYESQFQGLIDAFSNWVNTLPFCGLSLLCQDDENIQKILPEIKKPYVTYGFSQDSDIQIRYDTTNTNYTSFTVSAACWNKKLSAVLPMFGKHNALNATVAIALAWHLNIPDAVIKKALTAFKGVYRRFERYEQVPMLPKETVLIDDYGHHPHEIEVMLNTINSIWPKRRLLVFFQPHRYTRTQALFNEFIQVLSVSTVAQLFLVEEYPANEQYIEGATSNALNRAIEAKNIVNTQYLHKKDVLTTLKHVAREQDIILFQGAGDMSFLLNELGLIYV